MDAFWYINSYLSTLSNFSSVGILIVAIAWLFRSRSLYAVIATVLGVIASTSTLLRFYLAEVQSIKGAMVPAEDQNPLVFWLYTYGHEVCLFFFFIVLLFYFIGTHMTIVDPINETVS